MNILVVEDERNLADAIAHIVSEASYAADAVYFLMKPLEWAFLLVLYLCDAKPENRIAVQYPHAPPPLRPGGKSGTGL